MSISEAKVFWREQKEISDCLEVMEEVGLGYFNYFIFHIDFDVTSKGILNLQSSKRRKMVLKREDKVVSCLG